jgi:hypothetical protein
MQDQTGARWVEIEIDLYQDTSSSTTVHAGPTSSSPDDMANGIQIAHGDGLHVFVVPHLFYGPQAAWGGLITFSSAQQATAWFAGYWQALLPYLQAAQRVGAEQFALGNEYVGIEQASSSLWTTLIDRAAAVYTGNLTYNINHGHYTARPWMKDPRLAYIGVSMYEDIASAPGPLTFAQIAGVWKQRIIPELDFFSKSIGKPIVLSEIGYKNSTDTLYHPWVAYSTGALPDPQLQADAYKAALLAAFSDKNIVGLYFWHWTDVPHNPSDINDLYSPNGLPAAQVLQTLYLSPAA